MFLFFTFFQGKRYEISKIKQERKGQQMTVRELIKQLSPYADGGIRRVVTESGENIINVYNDGTYIILGTSEMEDNSLTIRNIIAKLGQCDQAKEVMTDNLADICGVSYECLIDPAVYLKQHI